MSPSVSIPLFALLGALFIISVICLILLTKKKNNKEYEILLQKQAESDAMLHAGLQTM